MVNRGTRGLHGLGATGAVCLLAWGCSSVPATSTGPMGSGGTQATGGTATAGTGGVYPEQVGGGSSVGGSGGLGGSAGADTGGLGGSADGGASGGVPGAGGVLMGTCGEPPLEVTGLPVSTTVEDEPLPPPQGGTLVDGMYDASTQVFYGDLPLPTLAPNFRQVLRIREGGTLLDQFSTQQEDQSSVQSMTASIVASGSDLMMSPTCPNDGGGASIPMPFSTRPGEIDLYIDYGSMDAIITHVLRQ